MLTKQQKLDVLSKAIDEGANIDIHFHNLTESKAAVLTSELAEMMDTPTECNSKSSFNWYQTYAVGFKVNAFYNHK